MNKHHERTFIMIKSDAVMKGLIGEIIKRFENRDLKIIALEMDFPTPEFMDGHYPKDPVWVTRLGEKLLTGFKKHNIDSVKEFGTEDPVKLGPMVREWLINYFTMAPVVKMVIEGSHAVDAGRKIIGATMPNMADLGTIRGDFSSDSSVIANTAHRCVYNLVHASETVAEAEHEINYWFGEGKKLFSYKRFGLDV